MWVDCNIMWGFKWYLILDIVAKTLSSVLFYAIMYCIDILVIFA